MPNISLPEAMQDDAERPVEAGATAFYLLRRDLASSAAEPAEEVDLRDLLLDPPV